MAILRDVHVDGRLTDVRIDGGLILQIGQQLPSDGSWEIAGLGGALIPGLHDHHLHLLATAAVGQSVDCGPPAVRTPAQLAVALQGASGTSWLRGIGYDESVAGDLDCFELDKLCSERPVRVQHRGGSLWIMNSAAVARLGPGAPADGRLWRGDVWLRAALGEDAMPVLEPIGRQLASYGVTGVTDATPGPIGALAHAAQGLPQHLLALGDGEATAGIAIGPRKIVLSDHDLPSFPALIAEIAAVRATGRAVAVHTVTRTSLLLLLAAFDEVGARPGDRLEHAAVVPAEAIDSIADLGLAVVTQPSLVANRGADYRARVDPEDQPHLWRFGSLLSAGVGVGCSSDAPYGDLDPWSTLRAARDRTTAGGGVLGPGERVAAEVALAGFLSPALNPGGSPRRVEVGRPADLVLLDRSLEKMLVEPDASAVRVTLVDGRLVYGRDGDIS